MTEPEPLMLVLEFSRANNAGDPFAFRFAPQDYNLRSGEGSYDSSSLPWGPELLADLDALRRPGCDPVVVQRIGELLNHFLLPTDWRTQEAALRSAAAAGRPIVLTIRSAAAELYALPWELLTLRSTGQPIGALPSLLVRYEWPDTAAAEAAAPATEGGRILVAWAGPTAAVPASEHIAAIQAACKNAAFPQGMDPERDVLPNVSVGRLLAALEAAKRTGPPIAILHLLCHGSALGSTFGLLLNGEQPGDEPVVVDAGRLRDLLSPYASMVRLVVLSACDSSNSGTLGNQLGSVAQTLHRGGVAQVVASRFPLSVSGSISLTQTFYRELLGRPTGVEQAIRATRQQLAQDPAQLDWASLQLYGRSGGGDGRPLTMRPYRGLLAFTPEHRRCFFGREKESQELAERVCALRAAAQPRLLAVDGSSGSGKSSVVLAGAVPALLPMLGAGARLVVRQPGSEPLAALSGVDAPGPVLLVIDQFEELFTQTAETTEGQKLRQKFAQKLWQLVTAPTPDVSVILTIRSDFVGRCGELVLDDSGLRLDRVLYESSALGHRISIAQLLPAQLRAVIEGPAAVVGLKLEPGLAERMLTDVEAEPGALPLLADTLDALWLRRRSLTMTQAAYDALGGVAGTLTERAEQLIAELGADEPLARRLLLELINVDEETGQRTRRRVKLAEVRPTGPDAARWESVLQKLTSARLLVRSQSGSGSGESVEVAHEALLRRWPRLGLWLQQDRQRLVELRRLEAWAREFEQNGALLRGVQLASALDLELVKHARAELPQAVRTLLQNSEQTRLVEEKKELLARDSRRLLAARQMSFDPTRAVTLLREVESADPTQVPEWLAQVTTILHRAVLTRCELIGHRNRIHRVHLSPDGALIATASADGTARLWEAQDGDAIATLLAECGAVLDVSFSPDGRWVVLATDSGSVPIYDLAQASRAGSSPAAPVGALNGHSAAVLSAQWSPDGHSVLTASADGTARLWSVRPDGHGGLAIKTIKGIKHRAPLCAAQWSPDGRLVVSADAGGELLVSAADGQGEARSLGQKKDGRGAAVAHSGRVRALGFLPDGSQLVSAGEDGEVRLWELKSGRLVRPLRSVEQDDDADDERDVSVPTAVAVHPAGTHVAICHHEGGVRIVRVDGQQQPLILSGHEDPVTAARFSPDGQLLATTSTDGSAALWGFLSPTIPVWLGGHRGDVTDLAFSADGRRLVTAASDSCARVWDLGRPALDSPTRFAADPTKLPEFLCTLWRDDDEKYKQQRPQARTDDGKRLASVDPDGKVTVSAQGRPIATLMPEGGRVTALALHPSGNGLAVAAKPELGIALWALAGPRKVANLLAHSDECYALCFSPDATLLASGALDWTVRIWQIGEKVELQRTVILDGAATLLLFSRDSKRLVIASESEGLYLWDREGGKRPLIDPEREEYCLAVRRDLGACITEDPNSGRHLWPLDLDPSSLRARLWRATPLCLSAAERQLLLGESAAESEQNHARSLAAVRLAASAPAAAVGGPMPASPATSWEGLTDNDD